MGGALDAYLYSYSKNLLIGTQKVSTDIIFLYGGGSVKNNAALRIAAPGGNIIVGKGENTNAPVGNILRGPNASSGSTNIAGGDLTIQGGSASGTATGGSINIFGGGTVSGTNGAVNININSNYATNINTGSSASNVMIGGSSNNILFPKFTTIGNLIYTAANTGQIGATSQLTWDNTNSRLGIGTSSPQYTLDINANTNPLHLAGVQTGTNTDSILTIVNGVVRKLDPASLTTSSSNAWALVGNSNATSGNFVGTTNNIPLNFKTSNSQRMIITTTGNFGIGDGLITSSFNGTHPEKVLIDAGLTNSFNLIQARGTINNYLQFNIQNLSQGGVASSDVVATADNGTEDVNYIDMGINSSNYNNNTGILGYPNTAYLYSTGNDFTIGNTTASKSLIFFTGGLADGSERMRIDGNGTVAINTTSPNTSTKLDVNGSVKLGSSGLSGIIKTTGSLSSTVAVPTAGSVNGTITVSGANTNASVIINPRTALQFFIFIKV